MGWRVVVALCVCTPALTSGCNIAAYATHNLMNEQSQTLTKIKLRQRMNAAARAAWQEERVRHPPGTYSGAYADGFIDGYTDHLDNGGTPAPPGTLPPNYRRHADDFTPAGQAAQRDYMVGFQHGAEAAAATGCRQNFVVPVVLPVPKPEQPLNIICVPAPANPPPMPKPTAPAARPPAAEPPTPAPSPLSRRMRPVRWRYQPGPVREPVPDLEAGPQPDPTSSPPVSGAPQPPPAAPVVVPRSDPPSAPPVPGAPQQPPASPVPPPVRGRFSPSPRPAMGMPLSWPVIPSGGNGWGPYDRRMPELF
ncbi:hypothetical protein R5W24_000950 [Gemmata sp. JC717]|uniref:hypothetical protein n=1 Tax=Gemmata algarum TaxID=2975278 RepID=UPI0021BB4CCC|nr:hypothetical protein [Gemmata algarum]MDY3551870.1 hypothetical protein [Gemmata algarum]